MSIYRVSLGFAVFPDGNLDEFTSNIIACLTGNTDYPEPPVALADLGTLQTDFQKALAAAAQGGKQATAAKDAAREALLDALRKEATYVQRLASHDLALLLASGFQANSKNRAQSELRVPTIVGITNGVSGQLTVRLEPVANARSYQVRLSVNGSGAWQAPVDSTQARKVVLTGLTPGTTYTAQARAVGGSTGSSAWSDPVSHMAT